MVFNHRTVIFKHDAYKYYPFATYQHLYRPKDIYLKFKYTK